jgi:hypothetical protein
LNLEIEENNYSISQNKFNEIITEDFDTRRNTVTFLVFKKGINLVILDEIEFI